MLALSLLFGCPRDLCDQGPPTLVLGQGDLPFTALAEGDTLGVEQGPQGGWHTFVSLQVDGMDLASDAQTQDELPHVTLGISDGDDPIGGYTDLARPFSEGGELLAERLVFVGDPSSHVGVGVTLEGAVSDRCDQTAQATLPVVLSLLSGP